MLSLKEALFYCMENNRESLNLKNENAKNKALVILKKGARHLVIKSSSIAYIYIENEITNVIDTAGKIYVCFDSLNKIEENLDVRFFRANRQTIINIDFIKTFRIIERTKIIVEMDVNEAKNKIYHSQDTAPKFREWITKL